MYANDFNEKFLTIRGLPAAHNSHNGLSRAPFSFHNNVADSQP